MEILFGSTINLETCSEITLLKLHSIRLRFYYVFGKPQNQIYSRNIRHICETSDCKVYTRTVEEIELKLN